MKNNIIRLSLAAAIFLISTATKAQVVTQILQVNGDCGMCKKRIETACYGLKGLKNADWNDEKRTLTVSFDSTKTSAEAILQRVAAVGYDNEKYKADDKAYKKLPSCCQYDRSRLTTAAVKSN